MVTQQPALAWAVSYMTQYDQLGLTLELLGHHNTAISTTSLLSRGPRT